MNANDKKPGRTPESVTDREKSRLDDDAVHNALTGSELPESGSKSVLPGPPIHPEDQTKLREEQQEGAPGTTKERRG